jgi:regulation of enolase protein 1 (concanavalin A-like superfamily)
VYSVKSRDALGNVTTSSNPVELSTAPDQFAVGADPFAGGHDFLAAGVDGTGWSGLLGKAAGSAAELIAITNGVLRLQSRGSVWDGGRPLGPFLFREVAGDFVAEVEVADYAGLATRRVPGNNDGGLMVRVPDPEAAGPGEDLVQLNFFPIWNQGNMVTTLDGGRLQKGNMLAWEAHRHLQIVRHGARFHFRTSTDGQSWREMPGSPVTRDDMAGMPLQVGLYQASYGSETSFVTFRNFRLVTRK